MRCLFSGRRLFFLFYQRIFHVALVKELTPLVANDDVDVVFCVPAIDIIPAMEAAKGTNIQIGAENMYFEESGAYTGEISPAMLTDAGVKYLSLIHI